MCITEMKKESGCNVASRGAAKGFFMEMLKHILIWVHWLFDFAVDFAFGLYYDRKVQKVPPVRNDLLLCSAVELAEKIRKKEVQVEDVVKAFIERAKEVNPVINAVVEDRYEDALREAKAADKFLSTSNYEPDQLQKEKPFFGVPFTTKDSHESKGMLHTMGLMDRRQHRSTENAPIIERMQRAGGILIAKTNVPELNLWQESRNNVYGQTRNPYNTTRTVGGSSGGEGALITACGSAISVAGDIGGSTRMPAFFNGAFGFKPTSGVLPIKGVGLRSEEDPESMVAPGPICKRVRDIEPFLRVMAADKAQLLCLGQSVNLKKLRVFYQESSGELRCSCISAAQRTALRRAVDHFRQLTGAATKIKAPGTEYSYKLWRYWMTREKADFRVDITNRRYRASAYTELVRLITGQSEFTLAAVIKLIDEEFFPKEDPEWAVRTTNVLKEYLLDKLGHDGVLFYPSSPTTAGYHYTPFLRPYNFSYWCIFNVLKFPVCQVPMGLDENGLPVGVQVVAAPYKDNICIAVAEELEKTFGGWVQPS